MAHFDFDLRGHVTLIGATYGFYEVVQDTTWPPLTAKLTSSLSYESRQYRRTDGRTKSNV